MGSYKYGRSHVVSVGRQDLGVPPIPGNFYDKMFTIALRNTGAVDATIYLKGLTDLTAIPVPQANDGIVLKDLEYDVIANGLEGETLASSTNVFVNIFSQGQVIPGVKIAEPLAAAGLEDAVDDPELDYRDMYEVAV